MALSSKQVKSYTRVSPSGKQTKITEYSRDILTTPNQDAGERDPLHNHVLSAQTGAGEREPGEIIHDPNKLARFCPAAHAKALQIRKQIAGPLMKLIASQENKLKPVIQKALKSYAKNPS